MLLLALGLALPASAQLFTKRDASGRTVVTNLVPGRGAVALTGGNVSVASPREEPVVEPRPGPLDRPAARQRRAAFRRFVHAAADRYRLSPRLLEAVIAVESNFDPRAVSRSGAQGLMQLMPETARELDLANPFDPEANIHAGARYLRRMLDLYGQDLSLGLAAYNAGPGAVRDAGGIPAAGAADDYVRKVRALLGGGILRFGASSLRRVTDGKGQVTVTNVTPASSTVQLVRDGKGSLLLTNR